MTFVRNHVPPAMRVVHDLGDRFPLLGPDTVHKKEGKSSGGWNKQEGQRFSTID